MSRSLLGAFSEPRLQALAETPTLYEDLAQSLAPSVWELDDIKKGILLQLFGASHKVIDKESSGGSARKRGDVNVLLVGDPGTAKSQLLQYVHKARGARQAATRRCASPEPCGARP